MASFSQPRASSLVRARPVCGLEVDRGAAAAELVIAFDAAGV